MNDSHIGSLGTLVTLTSNITSSESGSPICPGIIQLTCMARLTNVTSLRWFLNSDHRQEQVSYSVTSHSTDTFPLRIREIPQIVILSANLSVVNREINVSSTLTIDVSWFNYTNIRSISCGSFEQSASLETNYFIKGIVCSCSSINSSTTFYVFSTTPSSCVNLLHCW